MKFNYHTHTYRCGHAQGTEEEYIQAALAGGFDVLGFSDHTPYPFLDGYVSGCRMKPEEIDEYFEVLLRLKEAYKDRIRIHIGFETEYDPGSFARYENFLKGYPVEYMVQGQHFFAMDHESQYAGQPTDDDKLLIRYTDLVCEGIASGLFIYTAHPDLIRYTGPEATYEKQMLRICETAKRYGRPLELNLLGLREHRHYPSERFYKIAAAVGNEIVLGVDAHAPEPLADLQGYRNGLERLKEWGLNFKADFDPFKKEE